MQPTQDRIKEGNRLIAEFMEVGKNEMDADYYQFRNGREPLFSSKIHHKSKLQYHLSWDWIMPVCIKLKMDYVCTDINKTYNEILAKIKSLDSNT